MSGMSGMGWQATGDVTEFLAVTGDFLRAERVRNTVILSVTESVRASQARSGASSTPDDPGAPGDPGKAPLFGWWTDRTAEVRGAFMHTPPFPVMLTAVPAEAAADLAATALDGRPVAGVNSYEETASAFADVWRERTKDQVHVHRRMRLYRLAELSWPDPAPEGAPRLAGEDDVPLMAEWFSAFVREVDDMGDEDQEAAVRDRIGYGGLTVWEAGGAPVALAGVTRLVAGIVRVGPVYTPPDLRGRGYASAVTAEVSRVALAAGAGEVLLYTDLANPVSNSIYQRIGYVDVEDRVVLSFDGR
ncbi:MAG TPA: GNAT family N-acetyltransferase [Trebonia sp.]|nr:GNAT family N-acetyltransferase [Trebonia sp.]